MTDIETIRDALGELVKTYPFEGNSIVGMREAHEALDRMEASTLPELPEGWRFWGINFERACPEWEANICKIENPEFYTLGYGKTPRAAVLAAIAKIEVKS